MADGIDKTEKKELALPSDGEQKSLLDLVEQLGYDPPRDPFYDKFRPDSEYRVGAQKILTEKGLDALPALKNGANSSDAEIKIRTQQIVEVLYKQISKWTSTDEYISEFKNTHDATYLVAAMNSLNIPPEEAQKRAKITRGFIEVFSVQNPYPGRIDILDRLYKLNSDYQDKEQTKKNIAKNAENIESLFVKSTDLKNQDDFFAAIKLCTNLKVLNIEVPNINDQELNVLCELPKLKSLNLSCKEMQQLRKIPERLDHLTLFDCNSLSQLPEKIPDSVTSLYFRNCYRLTKLPELSKNLTSLDVDSCSDLSSIPALPDGLISFHIRGNNSLKELPQLPQKLYSLHLCDYENMSKLPILPPSLRSLYLNRCTNLEELPDKLPKLIQLDVSGCDKLTKLPELSDDLTVLDISQTDLDKLPPLKEGLQTLNISYTKLKAIPILPDSITELLIDYNFSQKVGNEEIERVKAQHPDLKIVDGLSIYDG